MDTIINVDEITVYQNVENPNKSHRLSSYERPEPTRECRILIDISQKSQYLVLYIDDSNGKKFFGWNSCGEGWLDHLITGEYIAHEEGNDVQIKLGDDKKESIQEEVEEGKHRPENIVNVKVDDHERKIRHMCVSKKKILAYIYDNDEDPDAHIGKYNYSFC